MVNITKEKNITKIGREPVVIFPLKKWEEIKELLEEREETVRFIRAYTDPKNQKRIPFEKVKKKLNLP